MHWLSIAWISDTLLQCWGLRGLNTGPGLERGGPALYRQILCTVGPTEQHCHLLSTARIPASPPRSRDRGQPNLDSDHSTDPRPVSPCLSAWQLCQPQRSSSAPCQKPSVRWSSAWTQWGLLSKTSSHTRLVWGPDTHAEALRPLLWVHEDKDRREAQTTQQLNDNSLRAALSWSSPLDGPRPGSGPRVLSSLDIEGTARQKGAHWTDDPSAQLWMQHTQS